MSGYPGQPMASASGMSTPIATTSRSGRAIKPVKQYQTQSTPQSLPTSSRPPRPSALNPHASSRGVAVPPIKHQLGTTAHPVLPLTRITQTGHEGKQAMFTSYPTRMRLGTSSLMQPSALAPAAALQGAIDGGVGPARGSGASTPIGGGGAGKRQRSTVNYAELGQLSDADDDDTDEPRSKRGASGVPAIVPKSSLVQRDLQPWGDGKSYLGVLPPGNMVTVQPAVKTRHVAT
jgi:chromatin structure-remodeling complex subunit SFH1